MAGFWTRLLRGDSALPFDTYDAAQRVLPEPFEPFLGYHSVGIPVADPGIPLAEYGRQGVEALWRAQPNVRKVVDFIARNVASIPLHTHERVSDTERRRVHDGTLAEAISTPRKGVSPFRFWHSVISDGLLYDRWAVLRMVREDGGEDLVQIPSWRLRLETDALRRVVGAWYWVGDGQPDSETRDGWKRLDLDMLVYDYGYAPRGAGLSPLATLADILLETAEAVHYRRQVWENGARVPAWMERPIAAPEWSPEAREKFKTAFRAAFTGDGPNAGGVPLLEDGMRLNEFTAFTPKDLLDLEGRRLSSVEVASAFHIAPELVGAREGTYSNVDAFRQMLYRDSLGPYITAWEGAINALLTPALQGDRNLYVEAHVDAKLRGSFQEQAQVMQSATGAPWMTRNEARAMQNRPPVEGGDELVVPLNVLVGGQASPRDSGSQNLRSRKAAEPVRMKARAPESHETRYAGLLADFFARQSQAVRSRIGAGREDWWDEERWDNELSADLLRMYANTSEEVARTALEAAGLDDYDVDRTLAFLTEAAALSSRDINAKTRDEVAAAAAGDDAEGDPVAHVFEVAESQRAGEIAATVVTFASGFGVVEAAKQNSSTATKTWRTTSANPRSSHARMDGETVGIDETFSNGLRWPGGAGDPDETAGCRCEMDINF